MQNTRTYDISEEACERRFQAAEQRDQNKIDAEGDDNDGKAPREIVVFSTEQYREESLYILGS
jgi:hypothetical protein